jgi:hypothetical protein
MSKTRKQTTLTDFFINGVEYPKNGLKTTQDMVALMESVNLSYAKTLNKKTELKADNDTNPKVWRPLPKA